jgi:hypothetical protein
MLAAGQASRAPSEGAMTEQRDPYDQPPYPGVPYGSEQYPAGPYAAPQYPAAPYAPAQHPAAPYAPAQHPAAPFGQPAGYGPLPGSRPAKPGGVVTAAVLGFVWGALGVLVTLVFVLAGVGGNSLAEALDGTADARVGARFLTGVAVFLALLALAWTVVMVWGGVLAVSGRSRVLLLVGGSVSIAVTGLYFVVVVANAADAGAGPVTVTFLLLAVSVLIVVLLCTRSASRFFAACRTLRAG